MYKPNFAGCRLSPNTCNHGCGDILCSEFDKLYGQIYPILNKNYKGHVNDTRSPSNEWLDNNFPDMPPSNTGATVWLNRTNQADKFKFMVEELILRSI